MSERTSLILNADGQPFVAERRNGVNAPIEKTMGFVTTLDQWFQSLAMSKASAGAKLRDPFSYHPWVFAAAMTIATTSSHAELRVFRETPEELVRRKEKVIARGGLWSGPKAGRRRRALLRHKEKHHTWKGLHRKSLEPDYEHPLMQLLEHPNSLQRGNQLMLMTVLWMAVRGEVFWVSTDAEGNPVPHAAAEMIWPMAPDLMSPVFSKGAFGELVAWDLRVPVWMPSAQGTGMQMRIPVEGVMQVKLPNPADLVRGMSRLTPVIASMEADLLATGFLRSLLENRAVPGGFLEFPGTLKPQEEDEIIAKMQQRHGGADKAGKLMVLQGGLRYNAAALTPQDLEARQTKITGREEVLGVMASPPSALGLQDVANYATAQIFDRSFWDKGIMPILLQIQTAIDCTYLDGETDDVFAMFDTSNVEAFRAGTAEKVKIAMDLTGQNLHMPPRDAFGVAGLEVPDYEGDDVCLVPALGVPLRDVLEPEEGASGQGPESDPPGGTPPPAPAPSPVEEEKKARLKVSNSNRWLSFIKVEKRAEKEMMKAYSSWIANQRVEALRRFEAEAAKDGSKAWSMVVKAKGIDVGVVAGDLGAMSSSLRGKARPIYSSVVKATFDLTVDELGGVPTFAVDDEKILATLEKREKKLLASVPKTVRTNLAKSLTAGVAAGETIAQLRTRVGEVFDLARSKSKTLTIARTEMGGLMNSVRHEMFGLQGFKKLEWVPAGDEHVRPDHVAFGEAGPKPIGFDYMTLAEEKGGGTLRVPGDPDAPAKQIVNCRCIQIPVE